MDGSIDWFIALLWLPLVDHCMHCAAGIDPYDPSATAASEIVCFSASFHGRTMGALALTYKEQYKTPFNPVMPGAKLATYQDLDSAAKLIKKVICAPQNLLLSKSSSLKACFRSLSQAAKPCIVARMP